MRTRRLVGRAVRWGARQGWAQVRPGRTTDLTSRRDRVAPRDGRAPRPDEVWVPTTTATGPWTDIDPLVAPAWPSRTSALASLAMWGFVGLRLYRAFARSTGAADDVEGRASSGGGS